MNVFIKEIKKTKGLFLYNPENNEEITSEFMNLIVLPDTEGVMLLSDDEKQAFKTNSTYLISSREIFNELVRVINRQQNLLDTAFEKKPSLVSQIRTLSIF